MVKKKKKKLKASRGSVTEFTVTLQGFTYDIDSVKEVSIDVSCINDELENQPGKYAEFSTLYVVAKSHLAICKRVKDVVYATMDTRLREKAALHGKKVTENSINREIMMSDEYDTACVDYILAEEQMDRLRKLCSSLDQRKDMLLALNANFRKEMEGV